MKQWKPSFAGGTIYYCLVKCLEDLQQDNVNAYECTINDVTIFVYKTSSIEDLCDKFAMKRQITYGEGWNNQ